MNALALWLRLYTVQEVASGDNVIDDNADNVIDDNADNVVED